MANSIERAPAEGAQTVMGPSIVLDGEISGGEDVVVQGTVRGKIAIATALYVEQSGVLEADVDASSVEVAGLVTGDVAARERVELKAGCKVVGDIRSPRILIADGAVFKGSVDMDVKGK